MTRSLVVLTCAVLVLTFYGHELWVWFAAKGAPVSALTELPAVGFVSFALLATGLTSGLTVWGRLKQKPEAWRGFRLLPMAMVLVLAVDFLVLSSVQAALSPTSRAKAALQVFTEGAQALASTQAVPSSPDELEPVLPLLGPVPWLVYGERPAGWRVEVQTGCKGPATVRERPAAGTVMYCLEAENHRAWVTLVGLPLGQARGEAGVVSVEPDWVGEVTLAREDAEPDDPEGE